MTSRVNSGKRVRTTGRIVGGVAALGLVVGVGATANTVYAGYREKEQRTFAMQSATRLSRLTGRPLNYADVLIDIYVVRNDKLVISATSYHLPNERLLDYPFGTAQVVLLSNLPEKHAAIYSESATDFDVFGTNHATAFALNPFAKEGKQYMEIIIPQSPGRFDILRTDAKNAHYKIVIPLQVTAKKVDGVTAIEAVSPILDHPDMTLENARNLELGTGPNTSFAPPQLEVRLPFFA